MSNTTFPRQVHIVFNNGWYWWEVSDSSRDPGCTVIGGGKELSFDDACEMVLRQLAEEQPEPSRRMHEWPSRFSAHLLIAYPEHPVKEEPVEPEPASETNKPDPPRDNDTENDLSVVMLTLVELMAQRGWALRLYDDRRLKSGDESWAAMFTSAEGSGPMCTGAQPALAIVRATLSALAEKSQS